MKKLLTLALAAATSVLTGAEVTAQTRTVILNTGYDQTSNTKISVGEQDYEWRVVQSVPDIPPPPQPSGGRPADVVRDNVWVAANRALPASFPNSQWISFAPGAGLGSSIVGPYKYAFYFILSAGISSPQLTMKLSADDQITNVTLNSCRVFTGTGGIFTNPPLPISFSVADCFNPAPRVNVITVTVRNTVGSTITGLIVQGAVAAAERRNPLIGNLYTYMAERDAAFEALRRELPEGSLDEERTGYGRYKSWTGRWLPKVYEYQGDYGLARTAMNRIVRAPNPSPPSPPSGSCRAWKELGPFDMPLGPRWGTGTGHTHFVDFDPANSDNLFAGSAAGGLFYSRDAGATWQSGGTDFLLPNIGAAHLAVDPNDPTNTWFLATGDGDGYLEGGQNTSHGVYRTTNKGAQWTKIGLDFSQDFSFAPQPWIYQIKKLLIDPSGPFSSGTTIYAATNFGLFRSKNAHHGFPNYVAWSRLPTGVDNVPHKLDADDPFYDIEFKPGDRKTIYASGATLVRSTNSGDTWSPLPGIPFLPDPDVIRITIEVTPADPNVLYVVVVSKDPAACNGISWTDNAGVVHPIPSSHLYRFDANTETWTDKGPVCSTGSYADDQRGVHYSRAQSIGVSRIDADLILIGDVTMAKCTTGRDPGFCSWTYTASNAVHNDIHNIAFAPIDANNPKGLKIYAAHDGGVSSTIDGGANWTPRSNGLRVATVQRMSIAATEWPLLLAGLFDEGTLLYNGTTWRQVYSGDGLTPIINHRDSKNMFASSQGSRMIRSVDGANFNKAVFLPCPNWHTFAILNPVDTQMVYGACQPEVLRSTTGGGNWLPISDFTALGLSKAQAWKLYTAPSNPGYLYAHLVGASPQLLMRSTNANALNRSDVVWDGVPHPVDRWISDIFVDEDPNKFWLAYTGAGSPKKVLYLEYDGTSLIQTDLTADLDPSLSVQSIVHYRGTGQIFIGTNLGVYTRGAAPNWTRVGAATAGDLPYVETGDLEINYVDNTLVAATWGRGVWEHPLEPCLPAITGPDAIIRDSAADVGNEPNNETGTVLWASDNIWVKNKPAPLFTYPPVPPRYTSEQHEDPEYSAFPFNTPYVYAKVRNRGDAPVSGTVHFYWSNASTGANWSNDWTEILPGTSTTANVVNLAPGGVWVASLQWTDIPKPELSIDGHFCLLARFVSTQDPIVGEVTGDGIYRNVGASNNIAWKNVTVVDKLQNRAGDGGSFIVRSVGTAGSPTRLNFDLDRENFLRSGPIDVDLGELFAVWTAGGKKSGGVKVKGPTTIAIQGAKAYIDNLILPPGRDFLVKVRFALTSPALAATLPPAAFQVTQLKFAKGPKLPPQTIGGVTFRIRPTPPGPKQSEICVTKFDDLNGNGAQDSGEPLLPGWTFQVKGPAGNTLAAITTGGSTPACTAAPDSGTYTISEMLQPGWTLTTPNPQMAAVSAGRSVNLSFGNKKTVKSRCDLEIGKTVTPDPLVSGQPTTVTITVKNIGKDPCSPGAFPGTVLGDPKPAGLSFTSSPVPNQPGWSCGLAVPTGDANCANQGPLPPGHFVTFTIKAALNALPGTSITNCATVTNGNDVNPANNKSCVTVRLKR